MKKRLYSFSIILQYHCKKVLWIQSWATHKQNIDMFKIIPLCLHMSPCHVWYINRNCSSQPKLDIYKLLSVTCKSNIAKHDCADNLTGTCTYMGAPFILLNFFSYLVPSNKILNDFNWCGIFFLLHWYSTL